MMYYTLSKLCLAGFTLLLTCGLAFGQTGHPTIYETAARQPEAGQFLKILKIAGLKGMLAEGGPYTLFLPNDQAINHLPEKKQQDLLENPDLARRFALDHLITGKAVLYNLRTLPEAPTMGNLDLKIVLSARHVLINNARLVKPDIEASNGVVHIIDRVLTDKQPVQLVQTAH